MTQIVLVDDHPILRTGLRTLIEREDDLRVVAETEDGWEAVDIVMRHSPDVVVMDLAIKGLSGLDATRELNQRGSRASILVLTAQAEEKYLFPVLQAGGSGYVRKEVVDEELVVAIRRVAAGEVYLEPKAQSMLLNGYLQGKSLTQNDPYDRLSSRERQIIKLTAEGHTSRTAAEMLGLSPKTIDTYRMRAMVKLNLSNRVSLVRYALKKGLIFSDPSTDEM